MDLLGHVELVAAIVDFQRVQRSGTKGLLDVEAEDRLVEVLVTPIEGAAGATAVVDHVEFDVRGEVTEELGLRFDADAAVVVVRQVVVEVVDVIALDVGGLVLEAATDLDRLEERIVGE